MLRVGPVVGRVAHNHQVAGSNPAPATTGEVGDWADKPRKCERRSMGTGQSRPVSLSHLAPSSSGQETGFSARGRGFDSHRGRQYQPPFLER